MNTGKERLLTYQGKKTKETTGERIAQTTRI